VCVFFLLEYLASAPGDTGPYAIVDIE
jgi:hypothetical protein